MEEEKVGVILNDILKKLGNPINENQFYNKMKALDYCTDKDDIVKIVDNTKKFLDKFGNFLNNAEFKNQVYKIIKNSYSLCEKVEELPKILENTSINYLTEILLKTKSKSKDVQSFLGNSFKNLLPGPQILTLSLLVESVLNDEQSLKEFKNSEEIQVKYKKKMTKIEIEIKMELDAWIQSLKIDLGKQDECINDLKLGFKNLAMQKGMDTKSELFNDVEKQCVEMLTMQFISASLMEEIDNDFGSVSIN